MRPAAAGLSVPPPHGERWPPPPRDGPGMCSSPRGQQLMAEPCALGPMPHWTQRDAEQKPMMAAASKPTASQGTASGHDRAANARTWGRAAVQWTPRPQHRARGQAWVSGLTVRGATPAPGPRPAHGGHSRPLERLPLPGAPSRASAYLLGLLLKAALLKPMLLTRVTNEETEASNGSVTYRMFAGQKSCACPQLCASVAATHAGPWPWHCRPPALVSPKLRFSPHLSAASLCFP